MFVTYIPLFLPRYLDNNYGSSDFYAQASILCTEYRIPRNMYRLRHISMYPTKPMPGMSRRWAGTHRYIGVYAITR